MLCTVSDKCVEHQNVERNSLTQAIDKIFIGITATTQIYKEWEIIW